MAISPLLHRVLLAADYQTISLSVVYGEAVVIDELILKSLNQL